MLLYIYHIRFVLIKHNFMWPRIIIFLCKIMWGYHHTQKRIINIWLKFFRMGKIHEGCHFSSILVAVYSKYKQWYYQNEPTLLINGQIGVLGFKVFHLRWDNLWAMTGPKILWWTYGPIVLGLSQPINGSIWDGILWIPVLQFVY